jgi:hypothetical protein
METSWQLYADPVCPFGWIASRWLRELQGLRRAEVALHPMSLWVLNEHRELDEWYRDFNEESWVPAQVAAATATYGRFEDFYEAFGHRVHVEGETDWLQATADALSQCNLPASLIDSAPADHANEAALRATLKALNKLVGLETGTPTLLVNDHAVFGPVLRAVPRGDDAVALMDAMTALVRVPAFTEVRRGDDRPLVRS